MRAPLTFMILMFAAASAADDVVRLDERQVARAGVSTVEVAERSFGDRHRVVGQVVRVPGSTLNLKAVVPGRVEFIGVAPGDRVAAGDVLVALHSHEMLSMQAELLKARERSRLAATRVEAGRQLFEVEGIARLELQQREQEAFAAELEVELARAELLDHGLAEQVLETVLSTLKPDPHLPVAAPVAGVVLELEVEEHEWVEELQTLLVMGDPERLELELQVAPDKASSVSAGDGLAFWPAGRPSERGRATVLSRVPQVDPDTRTMRLRARIVEAGSDLYAGVFVEGEIDFGEARTAPAVPTSAIINLAGEDVVFVDRGDGAFQVRPVRLGVSDGDHREVVSGVAAGDLVATTGVFLLKSTLLGGGGEGD
ncbi:MAG TPA: efflux RND transporter periplasmic adaptor subunit [Methylomirabilota bacterium]|nr:efflux RND transporter periplasmic adaptor subunit [Methylomirabilota bacterium]